MKLMRFAFVCTATALLTTSAYAGDIKRIKKEADFVNMIVGKKLSIGSKNSVVIKADGTSKGKFTSGKWAGVWAWQKGYFCSAGQLGDRTIKQDCKLAKSDGKVLQLTDNKGKGERTIEYTIN